MVEIEIFGEKVPVSKELWGKYMGTGNFADDEDGAFDVQTFLGNAEGNLSERAENAIRELLRRYKPMTEEEMRNATGKLRKEGLI